MLVIGLVCTLILSAYIKSHSRQIIGGLVINLGGGPDHTRFVFSSFHAHEFQSTD
jgi:hypothetical protein